MIGVGGDFADIYFDGNRLLYLTIIDVTGHGITAALLVNRVCSELRKLTRDGLEPNEILFNLNNFLYEIFYKTGMYLTMFSCMLDIEEKTCTYAGSAHPAVILWQKSNNEFSQLSSQNTIIGFQKDYRNQFTQDKVSINSGDKVVLYTDGLTEIEDAQGKQIGINGLLKSLGQCINLSSLEIPENTVTNLDNYTKGQVKDDIFLIVAEVK